MRRTQALVKIATAMMDDPHGRYWGYELTRQAGVLSGSLYPILRRMLDDGWVKDGWEDPTTVTGRPPRRYYELTDKGRGALGATLAAARREPRFRDVFAHPLSDVQWGFSR